MAAVEEHAGVRGSVRESVDGHVDDPSVLTSSVSASFEPLEVNNGRRAACCSGSSSFSPANTLDPSDPQVDVAC